MDNSGSIDAAELLEAAAAGGSEVAEAMAEVEASVFRTTLGLGRDADQEDEASLVGRCSREHDVNADGVLSFDEFKRLYNAVKGVVLPGRD